MGMLDFKKLQDRSSALTIRLKKETIEKLKVITKAKDVSQADAIETWVEMAYEELKSKKK